MRILNDKILDEDTVTADARSSIVDLDFIYGFTAQITWTATTAAATLKLEVSNDKANWVELSSPTATINNNSSSAMLEVPTAFYKHVRVFVDFTSGSITSIEAVINAKGI